MNAPPCLHLPASLCMLFTRTLFTRCCRLQFGTVMNTNYQRYPKTEQFITTKISGNALKQGSKTHLTLRKGSSQLQKYKAAQLSRRSEGILLGWRTPRVDSLKLVNYTRIEDAHKVRKKIFVSYYVTVICTINKQKEQIRACVSDYDQSA